MINAKQKKILSFVIKASIIIAVFWFIYKKIISNNNLRDFKTLLSGKPNFEIYSVLGLVFLLMFVNWFLESVKWKQLVKQVESISLWRSIESVFCGLTLAIFTPNRIGEYGGRVFFLSPKRRIVGVVAMAVGNIGQLVLTNVFGSLALLLFIIKYLNLDIRILFAISIVVFIFCLFFIVFYFNIKWLNGLLLSIKFTRKYKKFYQILARYSKKELFKILIFCIARFIVFTSQYYILFTWLIPGLNPIDIVMMICLLFFVQSTLPSLDLFDVGIRSLTASFFFSYITTNDIAVIASTASIWFINIIIPAILGLYFVIKLNFFGTTKS